HHIHADYVIFRIYNLEGICQSLELSKEGVKMDLIQRLKVYSNKITLREGNSELPDIRENDGFVEEDDSDMDLVNQDNMNSDVEENNEIQTLKEHVQKSRRKDLVEPSKSIPQVSTDSTQMQEMGDQPYNRITKANK
ncbi:10065_t:CDS:1, partial [Racocetra persica]